MTEDKLYHRQSYDTEMSWIAFSDYLVMEKPRTLVRLHSIYTEATFNRKPPTKKFYTLQAWYSRNQWKERAAEFDADQGAIATQAIAEATQNQTIEEWKTYRSTSRNSGKTGVTICNNCKVEIAQIMASKEPGKAIDAASVNKMAKLSKVISDLERSSHDMWGKAIGIEKLLNQLESNG